MKLHLLAVSALVGVFSCGALAASDDEEQQKAFAADCKQAAMEDSVPAEEMDDYIEQCVQDMAQSEGGASEEEESSNE